MLEEIVGQVKQMLKDAIEKSRSLSHELGPAVLSQSSLDDTFEWLARQMESKHGLVVHVQTRGRTDSPSEPVRIVSLPGGPGDPVQCRQARQGLGGATAAAARAGPVAADHLRQGPGVRSAGRWSRPAGFGLLSVRERAEFLGGRMKIKTALGKGSTFLIAVPDTAIAQGPA